MPPKGRKKGAASAKSGSNGIELKSSTNGIGEEFPVLEKIIDDKVEVAKSGRGRKKANVVENKEELEDKPVLDEDKSGVEIVDELKKAVEEECEDEAPTLVDPEKNGSASVPEVTEDDVGSTDGKKDGGSDEDEVATTKAKEEPEIVSGKRGRKKAEAPETDEVATAVEEEPEKALGKRGRKKAAVTEVVEDEVAHTEIKDEPEKTLGKRGRKKAAVIEVDEAKEEPEKPLGRRGRKKVEDEVVTVEVIDEPEKPLGRRGRKKGGVIEVVEIETAESNEEPQKVSGRRNLKKSEDAPQDEAMETEEEHAPPAKRPQNTKLAAAKKDKDEEDTEDFVPRKTRGNRNLKEAPKEVAAPVSKGRKRKVPENKAEVKQSKKGKAAAEAPEEDSTAKLEEENRQVKVIIERDHDIDEMARNSSLEEEKDTKAKSGKGSSKSGGGRKRANQDAEDSKPEKIQKEEPSKAKSGSKKPQIPDVTALDFESTSKTPDGKPWNFKIVSWNVNGVRAWLEKNGLSYLHHEKPDILCIQETKCSEEKLPKELEVDGYHCHWLAGDKDGYSGVGILSKQEPLSITEGIGIEEHDTEGRVITAEYEKFYLVTTYVPNSGRGLVRLDYRKKWDEDFRAYLKTLDEKKPVVLCGDLNVSHEEIDIANPKSNKKNAGFTQEERDGFSALLKEGFVDTFRHLYPDTKDAYTFWTYMMNARAKNVGWRLDYFVISERFKDHLCDSLIRKDVFGSDHCPVGLLLHI